jgi:hypothetical protein
MTAPIVLRDSDVAVKVTFGFEPLRISRLPPAYGGRDWHSCSMEEYPVTGLLRDLARERSHTLVDARCSDRDPSTTGAFRLLFLCPAFWPSSAHKRAPPSYVLPNLVDHARLAQTIQWVREPVIRNDTAGPMVLRIHLMPSPGLDTFELFGRRHVRSAASCAAR